MKRLDHEDFQNIKMCPFRQHYYNKWTYQDHTGKQVGKECVQITACVYYNIYGSTGLCWALASSSVSWSYTQAIKLLGRGISPSQGRCLYTGQHKHNKWKQISMPQVGFEPMIPAFERAKTVHALDRAASVIVTGIFTYHKVRLKKSHETRRKKG
jgi:hypothetical protein